MSGERGQVTLFVIVGIVVLFVIGLFFLLAANRERQGAASNNLQTSVDAAASAAVTSAVASCLDGIVNDELRLLGETGGLPALDGYPSGIVAYGQRERRMLYAVTQNRNDTPPPLGVQILPPAYVAPRYPDDGVRIEESDRHFDVDLGRMVTFDAFQNGYFGDVNFPAVCDERGANGPLQPLRCRSYPSTPPGTPGPSLQEGLSQRIAQRAQACASPQMFSDAIGRMVVSADVPTTNITFTPSTVLVSLVYPLVLDGDTRVQLSTVPRTYRVRFMPLWKFAASLAHAESRNATFDILHDAPQLPEYRQGFTILVSDVSVHDMRPSALAPTLSSNARVITITDTRSTIDGAPYVVSFLVENRAPMLQAFTNDELESVLFALADEGGSTNENEVGGVLAAIDPDDEPIVLRTSGGPGSWRFVVVDPHGAQDWMPISDATMAASLE